MAVKPLLNKMMVQAAQIFATPLDEAGKHSALAEMVSRKNQARA